VQTESKRQKKKSRVIIEVLCIAAAAAFAAYVLHEHTPRILEYLETDDISGLTGYIRGEGKIGEIVLIALQAVETISIFLPALPVYVCAGIIYGRLEGIIMCYITNLVINAAMFTFARRTGADVSRNSKYGRNQKVEEIMKRVRKPETAVLVISMLPVVPNGTIPYLAAGTEITFGGFMRSLAVGCLPSIVLNVICGDALLTISWHIFLPVIIVIAVLAAIVFILRRRFSAWLGTKFNKKQ
jgi:uncharacterized membrane protein YdjX (TVP38/TMEM64 family)